MMAECELATDVVRCSIMMILYERPSHGYAIIEALALRLGRHIGPGTVYPFLTMLLTAGYLTSKPQTTGKRERILYSMTPKGRRFSEGIFKRLSQIVSTALEPSLSRCLHCGAKLYGSGYLEKIEGKSVTFCCVHCASAHKQGER